MAERKVKSEFAEIQTQLTHSVEDWYQKRIQKLHVTDELERILSPFENCTSVEEYESLLATVENKSEKFMGPSMSKWHDDIKEFHLELIGTIKDHVIRQHAFKKPAEDSKPSLGRQVLEILRSD